MTDLDTLISRVRELKGPDREADALVFEFFGGLSWVVPPAYTASLDATVSLIEREMPGHARGLMLDALNSCKSLEDISNLVRILLAAFLTAIKERDA